MMLAADRTQPEVVSRRIDAVNVECEPLFARFQQTLAAAKNRVNFAVDAVSAKRWLSFYTKSLTCQVENRSVGSLYRNPAVTLAASI